MDAAARPSTVPLAPGTGRAPVFPSLHELWRASFAGGGGGGGGCKNERCLNRALPKHCAIGKTFMPQLDIISMLLQLMDLAKLYLTTASCFVIACCAMCRRQACWRGL